MVRLDEFSLEIDPEHTAIIVVDMTDVFVAEGAELETPAAREMVPRLGEVVDASRDAGIDVIYLRPYNRPSGADSGQLRTITPQVFDGIYQDTTIYEGLEPEEEDVIIPKQTYNGFHGTELDSVLRTLDIETVVITGTRTHICPDSTLRGAFFRGYQVVAIEDLVATADIPDQGWGDISHETLDKVWYSTVATNFGDVIDSEEYLELIE